MKKMTKWLRTVAIALAAALLISLTPAASNSTLAADAVLGIDVSSYQGDIDWATVAASGVQFAMVRVGNTKYGLDSKFTQNVVNANAAGIRVGVYCYSYALTVEEAAADAQLVVAACEGLPISFPVAIDIENESQKALSSAEQQAIVNTFCSIIYAAGYTPMVYSYRNWFETRLGTTVWDQWVANYSSSIGYTGTMWQFTDSGTVAGISGSVDLDYVLKDYFTLIPYYGLVSADGVTFYYANYRRQFGMQTIGDLTYYFDTTTGAMVTDQTIVDDSGNIIRMCVDGHVVIITAEMQQAAALALAEAEQQQALLVQYQAVQASYEQQAAEALTQYNTLLAMSEELLNTLNVAAANWMADPTDENMLIFTTAQTQYTEYSTAAAVALSQYETLQAAAVQAAASTAAQEVIAAQAQATSDAAQLTIAIPE